jgi:hypothetical protein
VFLGDLLANTPAVNAVPTTSMIEFFVPEGIIELANVVRTENSASGDFVIERKVFASGDIGDRATVEAPSSLLLLGAGVSGVLGLAWRRISGASGCCRRRRRAA